MIFSNMLCIFACFHQILLLARIPRAYAEPHQVVGGSAARAADGPCEGRESRAWIELRVGTGQGVGVGHLRRLCECWQVRMLILM